MRQCHPAFAQHTIVLVRHAERADAGTPAPAGADPELSPAGRTRAATLARVLADAKITAIFTTELKRTQQTAEPLAQVLGLSVTTVPSGQTAALIDRIKVVDRQRAGRRSLQHGAGNHETSRRDDAVDDSRRSIRRLVRGDDRGRRVSAERSPAALSLRHLPASSFRLPATRLFLNLLEAGSWRYR